jgi:hypothetical protein
MDGKGRARRNVVQGAKHSDAHWHREHLQRRSAPVSREQRRSDFSDSVDLGGAGIAR